MTITMRRSACGTTGCDRPTEGDRAKRGSPFRESPFRESVCGRRRTSTIVLEGGIDERSPFHHIPITDNEKEFFVSQSLICVKASFAYNRYNYCKSLIIHRMMKFYSISS